MARLHDPFGASLLTAAPEIWRWRYGEESTADKDLAFEDPVGQSVKVVATIRHMVPSRFIRRSRATITRPPRTSPVVSARATRAERSGA